MLLPEREVSREVPSASWWSSLLSRCADQVGTLICRFPKMSDTKATQLSKKNIQWGFELPPFSLKNFSQKVPLAVVNVKFLMLTLHCLSICLGKRPFRWHSPTIFFKDHARKRTFCNMSDLEAGHRKHLTVHRNSPQQPGKKGHKGKAVFVVKGKGSNTEWMGVSCAVCSEKTWRGKNAWSEAETQGAVPSPVSWSTFQFWHWKLEGRKGSEFYFGSL